jgi:hypothetical protein
MSFKYKILIIAVLSSFFVSAPIYAEQSASQNKENKDTQDKTIQETKDKDSKEAQDKASKEDQDKTSQEAKDKTSQEAKDKEKKEVQNNDDNDKNISHVDLLDQLPDYAQDKCNIPGNCPPASKNPIIIDLQTAQAKTASVPEASPLSLLGLGIGGLMLMRRRKSQISK